jgi:hypothetical protein
LFAHHPFHQVLEDALLHFMPVEAVGILVNVGLQVAHRVVHAPEPVLIVPLPPRHQVQHPFGNPRDFPYRTKQAIHGLHNALRPATPGGQHGFAAGDFQYKPSFRPGLAPPDPPRPPPAFGKNKNPNPPPSLAGFARSHTLPRRPQPKCGLGAVQSLQSAPADAACRYPGCTL